MSRGTLRPERFYARDIRTVILHPRNEVHSTVRLQTMPWAARSVSKGKRAEFPRPHFAATGWDRIITRNELG
jgi:hypothetical protein